VNKFNILNLFSPEEKSVSLINNSQKSKPIWFKNLNGSQVAIVTTQIINNKSNNNLVVRENLEDALYFLDDLKNIAPNLSVSFFPSSERVKIGDNNVILERIEVLKKMTSRKKTTIITYPKAIFEKLITKTEFKKNQLILKIGDIINQEKILETFESFGFKNTDFVFEPGDFTIRGCIIDVFSYGTDYPYRILLDDDIIEDITCFKVSNQISIENMNTAEIVSNIDNELNENHTNLVTYLKEDTTIWLHNPKKTIGENQKILKELMKKHVCIYTGNIVIENYSKTITFDSSPQSTFNKRFELLINHLDEYKKLKYKNFITVSSENQMKRLNKIFKNYNHLITLIDCGNSLKEGFVDHINKVLLYTDHQVFQRHHQYKSKRFYKTENALSIQDLTNLKKGDYITHFDYGIGQFDGLRIKSQNGKKQESIKIIYKNGDVLYISIHSLHKISKYKDHTGDVKLDKLGSPRWKRLKEKVKTKIKTVAFDLIELYAKRKITKGFAFSKDSYLQHELEASFLFQETEDQIKITNEIKKDMESSAPMDRLVCGDVGFGKTEIAIRAAFKAVADNKQVVILVPTTILAIQHYKTFQKRLQDFPCTIKYLNRFISKKETKEILEKLEDGLVDIIIGTHRIISKDVKFKDLGLLIIDEEQKFGVSVKDKLKTLKEYVDTLTLTATPIPRTLQFSLMGSRDLSIMTTYPKNRNPIETKLILFNPKIINEIITHEIHRGGQVFFVHNRISNIQEVHQMLSNMHPNINIQFAHGQMETKKLETTILNFINGLFDVLITTTIIENGLDIPNANTIIINNAQQFGLSDLHQMRGRVGRSNKKAFCYLITPPFNKIKDTAVKRLNAITHLSNLGDGFNIAMKDLEIRGAGNMLGAEQSGFIEEMGFSTYQRILDDAIKELQEEKLKTLDSNIYNTSLKGSCVIETDLELLIPNNYVNNMTERMSLYKRLNTIQSHPEIKEFEAELQDRFGPVTKSIKDLLTSIGIKLLGHDILCEKIVLKQEKMIMTFSKNIKQKTLKNIIDLLQCNQNNRYTIKEVDDTIKVYVLQVKNIDEAQKIIKKINI